MEETTSFIPEIYIGENGNWYIGKTDTLVPATGSDRRNWSERRPGCYRPTRNSGPKG
ncbi:hypothetical protein [Dorea sp. D27]|uniref:hypothetical protein n=1 Tax=Dorea sp. D27 TaxID=658665 RepID=UPI000AFAE2A1|nr:hypothetical protein [Dorea sp. D27]